MLTPGRRIRLSRARGFRLPTGAVNVARPGPFGNPFVVGKWGTAAQCVSAFAGLAAGFINLGTSHTDVDAQQLLWARIHACAPKFRGRDVACWCALDKPCHGDVLLHAWNGEPVEGLNKFFVDPPRGGIGMMAWDLLHIASVPLADRNPPAIVVASRPC